MEDHQKNKIAKMSLRGFRSIRRLDDFEPGPLTVLIGSNGAGKSNLIAFFRMLSWMMSSDLQAFIGQQGGASRFLFDGPKSTEFIEAEIAIKSRNGINEYGARLVYSSGDTFTFSEEHARFTKQGAVPRIETRFGAGHRESKLVDSNSKDITFVRNLLKGCRVYQFHDTSRNARLKQKWRLEENRFLKEDGANIAPILLHLKREFPEHYKRIVASARMLLPYFNDFDLEPTQDTLLLQWREQGSDHLFDASDASDGMLRLLALLTLLHQPPERMSDVTIIDEPELGLHPSAIEHVAALIKSASVLTQVIIATQSTSLLNYFEPEQIVVVEREGRESTFSRLEKKDLELWLEEYTLADIWEKNLIGGFPR